MSRMNFSKSKVWCLTAPQHWMAKWKQVGMLYIKITTTTLGYVFAAGFMCRSQRILVLISFLGKGIQLSHQQAGKWETLRNMFRIL